MAALNYQIPDDDDLVNLEDAIQRSDLKWLLDHLEHVYFTQGYHNGYDVMALRHLHKWGFRTQIDYTKPDIVLNLNLVTPATFKTIRRIQQTVFPIVNPYKKRRTRR